MATTQITRPQETDSPVAPELETAHRVHDEVKRLIAQAMNPGRAASTSAALRDFVLWVMRRAEEDGVVLSENDYVELVDAIARVDVAHRVGSLISELFDLPGEGYQWSGRVASMRHLTFRGGSLGRGAMNV